MSASGTQEVLDQSTQTASSNAPARANKGDAPIVILNQYYVPDVASTGHLLHELAQELARGGFDINVLTARPSYGPKSTWQPVQRRETRDGVRIKRMWTTRFSKDRLLGRVVNFLTFMVPLTLRMLLTSKRDVVYLYTTNPPFLGIIGWFVSLFRKHHYVMLLHDAYPQIAVWVGTIRKGGLIDHVWHWFNKRMYHRASETIVLCREAKKLVCDTYGIDPDRVHVIPNWADKEKLYFKPKVETELAKERGLIEPFTVLYSGNLGLYYEFDTILKAAKLLENENFRLVFVGSGGRKGWIADQIKQRDLKNTMMLPYQPFEKLNDSLNACDASLVTIAEGIEGISFPSKLYSSLAVGKPVLALSETRSEMRDLIEDHDVGRWFALGDGEGLADGIRILMNDKQRALAQGRNARRLFEEKFTRQASGAMYAEVFRLASGAGPQKGAERASSRI